MKTLHDLFEHELKDIYDAENKLVDALRKQATQSRDPKVRAAFQAHEKQTVKHVERVEQVFEIFGKRPSRGGGCAGIDGLLEEHTEFTRRKPAPEILDVFNLTAAQKVERYEITAYEGLITLANQLGLDDAVELLEENLEEEEKTLDKITKLADEEKRYEKISAR